MKVPFVELTSQYHNIQREIDAAIATTLKNGIFIGGDPVSLFEQQFADYISAKHCLGVNSGTDALILGARALHIAPGSEVIFPANTFYASVLAATSNNLKPVFVDCDSEFGMSLEDLQDKLSKKTAAVCVVHLFGRADKVGEIREIINRFNPSIHLIEDAAQAHGARYKNRVVGTFGSFSAFSFYPAKNLGAYGDGGMIATNSAQLKKRLLLLHEYGQSKKYHHDSMGTNSRLDTIQAAILSVKLKKLDGWLARRQYIARVYDRCLSPLSGMRLPQNSTERPGTYHLYVIRSPHRNRLQEYLHNHGIQTQIHYPIPLHLQKAFAHLGYKRGDFPHAEKAAKEMLSLPMYPELSEKQIAHVCQTITSFTTL